MNFEQNKLNPIFGRAQIIIENFTKNFRKLITLIKMLCFHIFSLMLLFSDFKQHGHSEYRTSGCQDERQPQ